MKNIVIVGGGVAGTITANYLAMKLREEIREKRVSITLIQTERSSSTSLGCFT